MLATGTYLVSSRLKLPLKRRVLVEESLIIFLESIEAGHELPNQHVRARVVSFGHGYNGGCGGDYLS